MTTQILPQERAPRTRKRRKAAPANHRKIAAYVRVSTAEQAEHGFSIEAQQARLEAFSVATGREPIGEFFVDAGHSGKSLNRPAIERLLAKVKTGEISAILIVKLDRLSRSLRDILNLLDLFERHHTALLSASESLDTSTAVGKMLVHMLGSFAEFERGRDGERIRETLEHKRQSRKVYSRNVPFGFRRVGERLVEVPIEIDALRTIREKQAKGASLRALAAWLTEKGFAPPQGGRKWYATSVAKVLGSKMTADVFSAPETGGLT